MLMKSVIWGFLLLALKGFVFYHGSEFPPLDFGCVGYGVGILIYSLIAILKFPKRTLEPQLMLRFYPSVAILGTMVTFASIISYGNSDEPFLLLPSEKYACKKIMVRLPGSRVMHFAQHPLNGTIHCETRVQRGRETYYGTEEAVMIKVKSIITYDIGTHEPRNHFPEDYKFRDNVRASLLSALYEIPSEAEPKEYESENFRRILNQRFSELVNDYGYESGQLGYNCKLQIRSISGESLHRVPVTDR